MSGALRNTLKLRTIIGRRGRILQAMRHLGSPEAMRVIRFVAEDRARTNSSQLVIDGMRDTCTGGQIVDFEAQGLASERPLAIGLLEDCTEHPLPTSLSSCYPLPRREEAAVASVLGVGPAVNRAALTSLGHRYPLRGRGRSSSCSPSASSGKEWAEQR